MDSSQLLELAVVAAACSYVIWMAMSRRRMSQRRCARCGHMYFTHDQITGDCRGQAGKHPGQGDDWSLCAYELRCPCREFTETPPGDDHRDLDRAPEQRHCR